MTSEHKYAEEIVFKKNLVDNFFYLCILESYFYLFVISQHKEMPVTVPDGCCSLTCVLFHEAKAGQEKKRKEKKRSVEKEDCSLE